MAEQKKEKTDKKEKRETKPARPKKSGTKTASNSGKIIKPKPLEGVAKDAKAILKQLGKVPSLNPEDTSKLLTAVALGLVKDRFGMDASLDTRLKAIDCLNKINNDNGVSDDAEVEIVDDIQKDNID